MQKIKRNLHLVVIVGILFVTGAVFANSFNVQKLGATIASADENEQGKKEIKDSEDEKDEVKNSKEEKDNEEKDNEDEKDEVKTNKNRESINGQKVEDNEDETDEIDGKELDEKDENDMQDGIGELQKDIKKLESKINVLGANGTEVSSFTAMLSEIKDLAAQAEAKIAAAPAEAEIIIESADKKIERLEKLVKMALGDEEDDEDGDETGKDAAEKIQEVTREAGKLEIKLSAIAETGQDVSALETALNIAKDLVSQAKEKFTAGDFVTSESLAEMAEKKIESVKHSMELAYGDDDEEDGDEADEYKNEVAKFVHNLENISQMDSNIGQKVKLVAQAQNSSSAAVESSIRDINDRSGLVKFLVGPKYDSISQVEAAIAENQSRIKILSDLINQVADPAVKQALQDQIRQFHQENIRLQMFIVESNGGISLLGWLVKLFN
jgi:hypothetical protein